MTFSLFGWSSDTEIVEYPHSAIGHRLSATKVYENNVPSLDWHGLKDFKDFGEFVNVSFFSIQTVEQHQKHRMDI